MTQIGRSTARRSLSIPGEHGQSVALSWAAATDIGRKRALNEDSFLAEAPFFVVADGMGGHASGDVASAAVVQRLAQEGSADFVEPEQIMTALRVATADITLAADDDDLGVGTTATGAVLTLVDGAPYWAVFNIGDSRVYQLADGELTQVTVDHSVVQELVDAGLLPQDQAEFHPDANIITRAVGFNAEPMADLWMLPVRTGLRLLICSDGLTREVSDVVLRQMLGAGLGPQETATTLVDAALAAGGRDNITLVIVDVVESPDTAPLENTLPRRDAATA
ncbi:PP2C family protein-serine/threonine phosphatase [Marisediminicola antarctica]|uniref:Protein phosphatase n=1 Tax=Marisediminicola antarctica TaxID=674079 RepID=A0A7L5AHY1_9MICO|nr:protein phosphatase 2C domain-containing protein [Marisediminicola antarctica]QHO69666.1 protein phosphatase [Marisediminicola antarctica]